MSVIAFVPARSGSKSILDKNIKYFCGKPLIYWILNELQYSDVDRIIVATDSDKIRSIVNSFSFSKVKVYDRDSKNAQDTSSTESVMLEYINRSTLSDNDVFMLVQSTSPFTQTKNFNEGLDLFKNYDSVLSCCISRKFAWREDGVALNYDIYNRPRRQDCKGDLIENGAFYISSVGDIKDSKNRISGNIGIYQMPDYTCTEIDEPVDWIIAESVMRRYVLVNTRKDFSKIKIFLSDVDGVLTDGGMYYSKEGDKMKKFCTHDGMGMNLLQKSGVRVGILTSEDTEINKKRAEKLNLDFDFHGVKDKLQVVKDLCKKEKINIDQIAYVGDDINCLELLYKVGVSACPNNAVEEVRSIPHIIQLSKNGGEGAVREFIELLLN